MTAPPSSFNLMVHLLFIAIWIFVCLCWGLLFNYLALPDCVLEVWICYRLYGCANKRNLWSLVLCLNILTYIVYLQLLWIYFGRNKYWTIMHIFCPELPIQGLEHELVCSVFSSFCSISMIQVHETAASHRCYWSV